MGIALGEMSSRPDWQRAALRRAIAPLVLLVVGIVLVAGFDGFVEYVGWAVVGIGAVVAVSLVFLEVGYSEDRERAREARAARRGGGAG